MSKEGFFKNTSQLWFVYSPEGDGIVFFKTEGDMLKGLHEELHMCYEGTEGWDDWQLSELCAGKITHLPFKTNVTRRKDVVLDEEGVDENGMWWDSDWLEMYDVEIREVETEELVVGKWYVVRYRWDETEAQLVSIQPEKGGIFRFRWGSPFRTRQFIENRRIVGLTTDPRMIARVFAWVMRVLYWIVGERT